MSGNAVAFTILIVLFVIVTGVGFAAARWRRAEDKLHLNEWGLGGRRFGTFITWFLLGGDLYTAYTFIAVPALVFGVGAVGFFAVPYTIIVFPIVFVFAPGCGRCRGCTTTSRRRTSSAAGTGRVGWRWPSR
jgi:solute:Na+ symporter, SSS family